jgi:hypothetical protein
VIIVPDPDAARAALAAGQLACPKTDCAGMLRTWTRARTRRVRVSGGDSVAMTRTAVCANISRSTQVLLPSWCLPRRAYGVEVVGATLLATAQGGPVRVVARDARVPVSTLRGWLRAVGEAATALTAQAVQIAMVFGDASGCQAPAGPDAAAAGEVSATVCALGGAAAAWTTARTSRRPTGRVETYTGIDYLGLLVEEHYRATLRRLLVADPSDALHRVTGWQLINVITAGRLLTSPSG